MPIVFPRVQFLRAGILLFLAVLVTLLGAEAKYSQFDGSMQHGYLSKAVKMSGARIDPNIRVESAQQLASTRVERVLANGCSHVVSAPADIAHTSIALLSTLLRV